ncbi:MULTISPECIES: serine/threonine-protein kinase [unclassified Spirillospora]|uniref:serine/threonine-protein kinase n=1 Tax=unclassified Spirillospora TaxID=2642701 RepID=UPI00371978C4
MPATDPLEPDDPSSVGPYRLSGRLGMGGQGVVYLGHGADGKPVAVKVLRAEVAADNRVRERFTKEIAAARRVDPFCIAQVLDASLGDRRPYIVTEYIEGPSLQQAGPRDGSALQRLAVATATALAAIHEAGVVHRDFKPSNVLLGPDGPRVIDFGIARDTESPLTLTSSIIGTPAYMAPEQFAAEAVGPPADVFAWGSVIVYAATGRPPFGADTFPAIMHRVLQGEPNLGDLPDPLRSTVAACLVKDPAQRPTMQAVLLRLLGAQAGAAGPADSQTVVDPPRPAPMPSPPPLPGGPQTAKDAGRKRKTLARRPVVLLGAGAGAVAVALLTSVAVWVLWPEPSGAAGGGERGEHIGANPQGRTGSGTVDGPGAGSKPGASGTPSPSNTASKRPGAGRTGSPGAIQPGTGTDGGTGGTGGTTGGGAGDGGGDAGGGDGGGSGPSGPTAWIDYFKVGSGAACEDPEGYFDLRYKITGSVNPTPITFSIYFNGRLGRGHPIKTYAEPSFASGGSRGEVPGTYTYRLVLQSPSHQEISRTVKVC